VIREPELGIRATPAPVAVAPKAAVKKTKKTEDVAEAPAESAEEKK